MPTRTLIVGNDGANVLQGGAGAELIYGFDPNGPQATTNAIAATRVAAGLAEPVFATAPPGDVGRLFIVEKGGRIEILDLATGATLAAPFLDITSEVNPAGEQGLLGLAFHPDYAANGLFYVYLSTPSGDTEVRRYQVSAGDPNHADAATAQHVSAFDYPATSANHRAGWIGFGPDDMLYVATGDGGIDPGNAQRLDTPLGKILRLDIDADAFPADPDRNYAVPADNPATIDGIAGSAAGTGFYAAGLRNPFRDSFDRGVGDLFIGNVGQASFEEINLGRAGANYGWPATEGFFDQAAFPSFTQPIHAYAHGSGASVTGGYVYRGESEGLHGQYFFADFVTGQVWTLQFNGSAWTATERTGQISPDFGQINNPSSFGEDARGNLYLVDFDGDVFRLTPQVASADQGDDLRGGGGDDMVFGGSGADRVFGEAGRDALDGGPGDDLLDGGEGSDQIFGGAGADTVSYLDAPRAVLINLFGQAAADGIDTDVLSSIENAVGSAFNDTIIGDAGANVLDGSDQIFGGGNLDTVSYAASPRAVLINLAGQVTADGINTDTLSSIENAIGSAFDDTIIGDAGPNILDGGREGSDQISGGGGLDTVSYAASPRAVLINLHAQITADGINTDTLSSIENAIGSGFDDVILSSDGVNRIDGGGGTDTVSYVAAPRAVLINLAAQLVADGIFTDTLASIENATGSAFADRIVSGAGANVLEGRDGNDTFVFQRGLATGDTVVDFAGNGAAPGEAFEFVGYGPGATFVQLDATHWQVNSGDGTTHETITLQNGAAVHPADVLFV
ncbi:MAG: PQQ-dependent sugar dehydrogenase [Microvirga sp.]